MFWDSFYRDIYFEREKSFFKIAFIKRSYIIAYKPIFWKGLHIRPYRTIIQDERRTEIPRETLARAGRNWRRIMRRVLDGI